MRLCLSAQRRASPPGLARPVQGLDLGHRPRQMPQIQALERAAPQFNILLEEMRAPLQLGDASAAARHERRRLEVYCDQFPKQLLPLCIVLLRAWRERNLHHIHPLTQPRVELWLPQLPCPRKGHDMCRWDVDVLRLKLARHICKLGLHPCDSSRPLGSGDLFDLAELFCQITPLEDRSPQVCVRGL